MLRTLKTSRWSTFLLFALLGLAVVLAGCGGASTAGTVTSAPANIPAQSNTQNQNKTQQASLTNATYLIKSLNITMELQNTQQGATDLQTWVSSTDPLATANNIDYQPAGNNLYNITISFSIQASLFPRIENYMNNYPASHHGRLVSTTRNTQDVTGDYIDTQSRLKNLRAEQDRLLTLESHAAALSDILAIDQQLTTVEGEIEQIEAHLNSLTSQTSFYTITVSLQPPQALLTPPPSAWNAGQIWQSAVGGAIVFGQVLLTIIIWLLAFSIYIVPAGFIIWFVRRWQRSRSQYRPPFASTFNPPLMKPVQPKPAQSIPSTQPQQHSPVQSQIQDEEQPEPQLQA